MLPMITLMASNWYSKPLNHICDDRYVRGTYEKVVSNCHFCSIFQKKNVVRSEHVLKKVKITRVSFLGDWGSPTW